jgi:biopolymer transport protein ExbB
MVQELSGVIRMNAKDIDTFLSNNFLTGVYHPDTLFLKAIAELSVFPGMDHVRKMADLLFDRIGQGGAVSLETAAIVDRTGKTVDARVLLLGGFTAAYALATETGFLNYTPGQDKLFALSRLPAGSMAKKITRYMEGQRDAVPMDISRGAALNQLTYQLSLWDQIPKGGPIVWPILAILAIGALIATERLWFLLRRKIKLETVVSQIETAAFAQNWTACQEICARYLKNPVVRVIRAGLSGRELPREDMENTVQEAILREIPPMERFLSTMGMLAAIAPLLGLLGTVTGMIDTFHVITMHGTGDPRMMSGGISEALVTTMLGLSVAIPIMLVHTLLSREVENTVGLMEEKAVALINIIQKQGI